MRAVAVHFASMLCSVLDYGLAKEAAQVVGFLDGVGVLPSEVCLGFATGVWEKRTIIQLLFCRGAVLITSFGKLDLDEAS